MQIELLPRDLRLDSKSRLTISPIPELASLRQPSSHIVANIDANRRNQIPHASGSLLELRLHCTGTPANGDHVGFQVLAGPGNATWTTVGYNYSAAQLFIDHRHSSVICQDH